MCEILFRGKRVDNGEWVEGFPYITHDGERQIRYYDSKSNIENCSHTVIPDTLGRFTGLTDCNGVKIFEGDILACHNNSKDICKVVLGEFNVIDTETFEIVENVVGWHTEVIPTADPLSAVEPFNLPMPLNRFYIERGEMVVIGNIHDTPELLEVSGNE